MSNLPITEARNQASLHIDEMSTLDMLRVINQQDQQVALAVEKELPQIAQAVEAIAASMEKGGRLFYAGAGTSGRLGVLDASECPPTYGVPPELVVGIIAGGDGALRESKEGAEDDEAAGRADLLAQSPKSGDVAVGLSVGGGAPYVLGFVAEAKARGLTTVALSCNPAGALAAACDIAIVPVVGPEVITGSSRMKSGTAQKMVLNMLSTGAMVRLGKVYGNLMVDMRATNQKLRRRAVRIVSQASGADEQTAQNLLAQAEGSVRVAIVMHKTGLDAAAAAAALEKHGNRIAQLLRAEGIEP